MQIGAFFAKLWPKNNFSFFRDLDLDLWPFDPKIESTLSWNNVYNLWKLHEDCGKIAVCIVLTNKHTNPQTHKHRNRSDQHTCPNRRFRQVTSKRERHLAKGQNLSKSVFCLWPWTWSSCQFKEKSYKGARYSFGLYWEHIGNHTWEVHW